MEPDLAASVADRDDAAVRATGEVHTGFDAQHEASPGCRDGADVDALDTEQRIRAHAPAASRTRHRVIHVRVSFWFWLLGRYQFKEALTSFLPHHAAPQNTYAMAPSSDCASMLICEGPSKATATGSRSTNPTPVRHNRTTTPWPRFQLALMALFSVGVNSQPSACWSAGAATEFHRWSVTAADTPIPGAPPAASGHGPPPAPRPHWTSRT